MKKGDFELTESKVAKLKPRERNYFVCDRSCPGFGVEVTPAGSKRFVVKTCITVGGVQQRQWHTLGHCGTTTVENARLEAAVLKAQVRKGEKPKTKIIAKREALRVSALLDRFYKEEIKVKVSWAGTRLVVEKLTKVTTDEDERQGKEQVRLAEKFIRPVIGDKVVKDIGTAEIASLLSKITVNTPIQANRVRGVLSRLFAKAEIWEIRTAGSSPVTVQDRAVESKRERNLSDQEIVSLGSAIHNAYVGCIVDVKTGKQKKESPYALAAVKLAILAGMRKGEIQKLRWDWVNLKEDEIRIPPRFHKGGKKSQKVRVVRLCSAVRSLLESLPRHVDNPYVIVGKLPGKALVDIQGPWERIRVAAGLAVFGKPKEEDPGLHDLRRTFASVAARLGTPELFISALLGHAAFTVTQGYARVGQDPLRDTVEEIGDRISALLSGEVDLEKENKDAKEKRKAKGKGKDAEAST